MTPIHPRASLGAITFRLDTTSGLTPYLQLTQQVTHALRLGQLKVGDRLPTVRDVAAQLAINPNTVLKAYRHLEMQGLLASRPGTGVFVAKELRGPSPQDQAALRRSLLRWLNQASAAGLDTDGAQALFADTMRQHTVDEVVAS
ncbi:MAG TPA: GntR family transcriptional regulator [Candidatus Dormibacteraeota bacterium]|nr:GntR family transcriptional regulator [Candidatus Dormibacteraeota bacterium]